MAKVKCEFHMCVFGAAGVGKTSLLNKLSGKPFNRKSGHKPSIEDEATQFSIEVMTSVGIVLFHLFDWSWAEKRKDEDITRQVRKGKDGAIFVYDCTEKRSKGDFFDFCDWYEKAAGYDKPWMIIQNKDEQKKKSVNEGEGQALANKGNQRCYMPISLADDTPGNDEIMLALTRLMVKDLNLTVSSVAKASESSMQWSLEKAESSASSLSSGSNSKSQRVLLLALNSSVVVKFDEVLSNSSYVIEQVTSIDNTAEILSDTNSEGLPISALIAPPTCTDGQKLALNELAKKYSIPCIITVPRSVLDELENKNK